MEILNERNPRQLRVKTLPLWVVNAIVLVYE